MQKYNDRLVYSSLSLRPAVGYRVAQWKDFMRWSGWRCRLILNAKTSGKVQWDTNDVTFLAWPETFNGRVVRQAEHPAANEEIKDPSRFVDVNLHHFSDGQ